MTSQGNERRTDAQHRNGKRPRIGTITFHDYDNYGAVLQSYALIRKLEEAGVSAEIIDYSCDYIQNAFSIKRLRKNGFLNYVYGVIGHICYLPRRKAFRKFRRRLKYSEPMTAENVKSFSSRYDAIIAGSDQIWDYKLTDFDRRYFLDFVKRPCKKFSYAASIGENLPPEAYRKEYAKLLGGFDHTIVRESYGADIVETLTGKRPEIACDPTLLLTAKEWVAIAEPRKIRGDYILVYQLGVNPFFVKFVEKLKKKTCLQVIYVPFPLVGFLPSKLNISAGPERWIRLFMDAKYVVSDSFHGIVFALIFRKKFFSFSKGYHRNRRVEELLDRVGLSGRDLSEVNDAMLEEEIDYDSVNKILANYRAKSLSLLKKMIREV